MTRGLAVRAPGERWAHCPVLGWQSEQLPLMGYSILLVALLVAPGPLSWHLMSPQSHGTRWGRWRGPGQDKLTGLIMLSLRYPSKICSVSPPHNPCLVHSNNLQSVSL